MVTKPEKGKNVMDLTDTNQFCIQYFNQIINLILKKYNFHNITHKVVFFLPNLSHKFYFKYQYV